MFAGLLLAGSPALAGEPSREPPAPAGPGAPSPVEAGSGAEPAAGAVDEADQEMIDVTQEVVTSSVVGLARWVDAFFDDPNYTEEEADARLEVRLISTLSAEESAEFRARTRFRVNLPRLSRRTDLVFEGNDANDILDPDEQDFEESVDDAVDSPSIGLQYFRRDTERTNLSWSVGVRTSSASLYVGPRFRYQYPLDERSLVRFTQRLRWYTEEGWQSDTRFDFDRRSQLGFFRQFVAVRWREDRYETEGARINLSTSLTQPLSEHSALRYSWSSQYPTRAAPEDRETGFYVGYRQRFWRDWIALQITPFIRWQQRNDWDVDPGVRVSLTFAFEREQRSQRPDLDLVDEAFDRDL